MFKLSMPLVKADAQEEVIDLQPYTLSPEPSTLNPLKAVATALLANSISSEPGHDKWTTLEL